MRDGQGVIPDDWLGEYCRFAVCWPNSEQWLAVLRGVLTLPARGRFWDEHTGTITEAQSVIRETFDSNLHLEGVIMSCGDGELVLAFSEIAQSIRYLADRQFAKPDCCDDITINQGSAGYAGTVVQPVGGNTIPIYGNQPPAILPPDETFPEGFESVEEWDAHKCAIANLIFDGVMYTLGFLAGLNTLNITVLAGLIGAGIAGILVFPPVGLAVMVGAVAALFGFLAMFLEIKNEMTDRREEFVCVMYEAESVAEVISILADLMDIIIAIVTTSGPLAAAIKTVLLLLFNGDALNQLFDASADFSYPDADCAGCAPCEAFYWETDEELSGFAEMVTLPDCFELTLNGSAELVAIANILEVTVAGGSPNPNGAFGRDDASILVTEETQFEVSLRMSGAGSLYIDAVLVFDDLSCSWFTLSNNDPASGTFHGISQDITVHTGKVIEEVYLYLQSSNAGPDNEFFVEFEKIGVFCG